MPNADLSIRHQKRRLCFTLLLLLLPSSSMEFLRGIESLSYEFYPPHRPDTSPFKHKTKQKCAGKTKSREKTGKNQETQARTAMSLPPWAVVGPTVSSWWALPGLVLNFLERPILVYFLGLGIALDLPVLGLLGLLFNLSSLGLASTHLFLLKLGLNHANLQSQLNKAKTERNQRNTCINRKLIPNFKPKSSEIPMHIYTYQTPPCLIFCLSSSKTIIKINKGNASMGCKLHLPPQVRNKANHK